jgi:hypothetical protein
MARVEPKGQRHRHHEAGIGMGQDRSAGGGVQCHCIDVDEPLVNAAEHICDLGHADPPA